MPASPSPSPGNNPTPTRKFRIRTHSSSALSPNASQHLPTLQASGLRSRRNQPACRTHTLRRVSCHLRLHPPYPVSQHQREHHHQQTGANRNFVHHSTLSPFQTVPRARLHVLVRLITS